MLEIQSYQQAVDFLWSRINFERIGHAPYTATHYRLDRMRAILRYLDDPHLRYPVVHVAGTKGKGTVCTLVEAALRASGQRTGLYTSPHFHRLEERFRVGGKLPTPNEVVELTRRVADAADRVATDGGGKATFFELTTAMGFLHFAVQQVDLAVIEVGLGGRLDSTNVCQPECCVITSISYDHQRQLGTTLQKIAGEKAGIIKPGVPVITVARAEEAREVILDTAARQGAPALLIGRDFDVRWQACPSSPAALLPGALNHIRLWPCLPPPLARLSVTRRQNGLAMQDGAGEESLFSGDQPPAGKLVSVGASARSVDVEQHPTASPERHASTGFPADVETTWPSCMLGAHQADNVAAAVAVLRLLADRGFTIDWHAAREAIANTQPLGRLQVVGTSPLRIIDNAHNVASIDAGMRAIDQHLHVTRESQPSLPHPMTVVFAASRDKDYRDMLERVLPACSELIVTQYRGSARTLSAGELHKVASEVAAQLAREGRAVAKLQLISDPAAAWHYAVDHVPPQGVVYATGSFFFAADLLTLIDESAAACW
ncbi:MAG: hypothetical protein KatS3mg111_3303 [Pirellulaceae bacterium]|nr:MAG: hypothetical protein KatS3mg111_3303 [Pirellulaceae bacterium]